MQPFVLARERYFTKRVALNSFWLLAGRGASQLFAMLFTVLVARGLGEAGLGQVAFITAILSAGNVLTTFGLDMLLIRGIARFPENSRPLSAAALWLQLGLSVLFIVLLAAGSNWLLNKTPEVMLALRLYCLALIPMSFLTVFSATQRAHERMDLFLLSNVATSIFQAGAGLVVIFFHGGLVALVGVMLAAQILGTCVAGWLCAWQIPSFRLSSKVTGSQFLAIIRAAWPLALLAILAVAYQRIEVILLSSMTSDATTGLFTAAARVSESVKLGHYALLGALFPVLARFQRSPGHEDQNSPPAPSRDYGRLLWLLPGFGVLSALALTFFAEAVIGLLFGLAYAPSVMALKILVWSLVPYGFSAVVSVHLVAGGNERVVTFVTATGLVFLAVSSVILISRSGLIGASQAVVIGETVQALAYLLYLLPGSIMQKASARKFPTSFVDQPKD